jgi:predicted lipase
MIDQELLNRNKNINRGFRNLDIWKEAINLFVFVRTELKKHHDFSYKTKAQIKKSFPKTVRVAEVADTEVQYFLELHPDENRQIITVRGTANLANVKEDAEYIPSKNKKLGIYVHSGFDDDATKLYADVLPHLNKEHKVTVTGHSLGAAIATLLMMYLHEDGFDVERSINFGQPKVTNKKGVKRYEFLPLTRVVDENDVVPLVPPITLLDSIHGVYEHLGEEFILLEDAYYVYLEKHNATRKSIGSFWKNIGHESISEHYMTNYLKNIQSKKSDAVQVPYNQREEYIPH